MNRQLMILLAEIAALVVLRVIYQMRRDKDLPHGSKVNHVDGSPVYKPSEASSIPKDDDESTNLKPFKEIYTPPSK